MGPTTLAPIAANAGIEAWYRRQLTDQVESMRKSVLYWLSASYRSTGLAADALPSTEMERSLRKLSGRWQTAFQRLAISLGKRFASSVESYTDKTLDARMRAAGMTVPFTQTPAMKDALAAVLSEQTALIHSLPSQTMTEVQGLVMRSVARGRDLGYLSNELQQRFGVTKRRAALIARDQNNKATSVMSSTRQQSLGITQGVWRHSHAGKVPRPSHLAADGQVFDLKTGLQLDGEWVLPGEAINCRCTWSPVIPGLEDMQ